MPSRPWRWSNDCSLYAFALLRAIAPSSLVGCPGTRVQTPCRSGVETPGVDRLCYHSDAQPRPRATRTPIHGGLAMQKRWLTTLLVALTVLGVGLLGAPAGFAQAPIKIGVIEPLSGPVAASGNYIRMGAEIARDWINAKGGVGGRKLELLIEDNKSDPKEAASAAEKLIVRDKVPAIMGAWGSSMTLAAMPKLEEYGVPMVVETSSAASITKRGNPWVFRISPP